jgi:RimJ/RimL family protein N-acetyltransferase
VAGQKQKKELKKVMLQKLERKNYFKVTPIFKEMGNQIVIGSVIEGNTCGDIYVDCLEAPAFAVLWDKMDAVLIEGVLNEDYIKSFVCLILNVFKPDAISRDFPFFNVYYPNETWADVLGNKLKDLSPVKELKFYYEYDKLNRDWESSVQNDYVLKRIDESILEKKDLKNMDKVIDWIKSFWPSTKEFVDKGIGYCLLQDEIIVSWCLSVFVSGEKFELGLETIKDYRGKGCAKVVSSACIEYCMEHYLVPLWNCNEENKPSVRVAEAIGFKKIKEYYVWHINLRETP